MKPIKQLYRATVALMVVIGLAGTAWADPYHPRKPRNSIHWGINIGAPWPYSPFYHPFHHPYFPPYPLVILPSPPAPPPPVYIERQPERQSLDPGFWYYCRESQAYYPYARECVGPWEPVPPQPPQ